MKQQGLYKACAVLLTLALLLISGATLASSILTWSLDETSGSSATDSSGQNNTGTVSGGTTWVTGKVGGALSFNGSSGAVTRGSVQGMGTGNAPHTIAAWVKVNALPSSRTWIALLGPEGPGSHHWLLNYNGSTQLGVWNGAQVAPTLPVGIWKHIAITFDGAQLKGYIDGTLIGTQAASFGFTGTGFTLAQSHIGEEYFNGVVDDAKIYNTALSAAEVAALAGAAPPPLAITTTTLASGTVGSSYSQTLAASGGSAPYTWSITTGSLPAGLTLNASTGVVSGTPTTQGSSSFTVKAQDSASGNATQNLSIVINSAASGEILTWSLDEGAGTTATDSSGQSNTGTFSGSPVWVTGKVGSALSFNGYGYTGVNRSAVQGMATGNAPHTIAAWVKVNAVPGTRAWIVLLGPEQAGSHHWTINSAGGVQLGVWSGGQVAASLPPGEWKHVTMTFDGSQLKGYINGNLIDTQSAAFNFAGTAFTVATTHIGEESFNGVVDDVRIYNRALSATEVASLLGATPIINVTSVVDGTVGGNYSQTLTASGGTGPYTWSVSAGSLPAGLNLSTDGILSGTPTTAGANAFTLRVQDSLGASTTLGYSLNVNNAGPRTNIALQTNGGVVSASSSHDSSNFPTSAVNNGDTLGTSYWNDNTRSVFPDWVQVKFPGGRAINEIDVYSVQDNASSPVTPTSTMTFTQYGLTAFDVQYWNGSSWVTVPSGSITGNNLVWRKLTFATVTTDRIRVLVNAVADGLWSRVVEVEAYTAAAAASPLTISTSTLASGTVSSAYSQTLAASGGSAPYTWSITTGTLPAGLTLNASTGVISGTPTTAGTSSFTVKVQDSVGANTTQAFNITIAAASGSSNIYYIYADHLNTPRVITATTNTIVWRWDSDPFGTDAPNQNPSGLGTFNYNLRFPGQYFDQETGLNYNYFRNYDPSTGRYVQSDPMGLRGGLNTYAYVSGNPMSDWDPFGLFSPGGHDLILTRTLGTRLTPAELRAVQRASRDFDKRTQGADDCPLHSMRCTNQTVEEAIAARDDFIGRTLARARELNKSGNRSAALQAFGEACHPIMDWSSPEHTDARGNPKIWRGAMRDGWGHSPNEYIGNETAKDVTPSMLDAQRQLLNHAYDSVFGN